MAESRWNALYLVAAIAMVFMTLATAIQPLFLRNVLGIAFDQAGAINANVQVVTEVLTLVVIGYLGFLSDRFGRVPIMTGGFLVAAAGGFLAPLSIQLGALFGLGGVAFYYLARIIMSAGTSAVWPQLATLAGDFTGYDDRAQRMAKAAFMMAFGSTLVFAVLMQIPKHTGIVPMMVVNAVVGLAGAVLASRLLSDVAPKQPDQALPWRRILDLLRREPRLRIAFAAGLFSRSDIILVGLFYMLWTIYFADLVGKTQVEAGAHAGKMIGVVGLLVMATILVWGRIVHRIGRVKAIIAGLGISGTGFVLMGFAVNPFDWYVYLPMVLIALGQSGTLLAPEILAFDLTPEDLRGSMMGALNIVGGIGLVLILQFGGYLFDAVGPYAPFMLTGIGNLLVLIYTLFAVRSISDPGGGVAPDGGDLLTDADDMDGMALTTGAGGCGPDGLGFGGRL